MKVCKKVLKKSLHKSSFIEGLEVELVPILSFTYSPTHKCKFTYFIALSK